MIRWDEEKERWLVRTRGISFHDIADRILAGDYIDLRPPTRAASSTRDTGDAMRRKDELDALETAIEADSDAYVPIAGDKRKHIEGIVDRSRKTRNVNIRISEYDLHGIRRRAEQEGIPYQTLMSSVLHRFVTDRLVDEDQIRKAVKLLAS